MTARILAVDDIATNLRLLEAKLQVEYYEVLLASSGSEALQVAFTQLPDVILLDVMMPGMDGYEVCRALRAVQRCPEPGGESWMPQVPAERRRRADGGIPKRADI